MAANRRVTISAPEKDRREETGGIEQPSQRLRYLTKTAMPDSLNALGSRYDSINQVVQYLEESHMSAVAGEGVERSTVEVEARSYIVEALLNITSDIDLVAANLEQILELQTKAVDSLTTQVDLVRSQIIHTKENDHVSSLHEMTESRTLMNRYRRSGNEIYVASRETKHGESFDYQAFTRIPLEERLRLLDGVGVVLPEK